MLAPVKALFFGGCNDLAVGDQCGGRVVKYAVDSENNHVAKTESARILSEK
jgi:hypothetical protein